MRTLPIVATVVLALCQPVAAKQVSESEAAEAMYAARPIIERIFLATSEQTQNLLGSTFASLVTPPSPMVVGDAALFDRIDPAFTSFGDESVPLEVRLIEFMRQDAIRTLDEVKKISPAVQDCGLSGAPMMARYASAASRKKFTAAVECTRKVSLSGLESVREVSADGEGEIASLKLPSAADALLHSWFKDRDAVNQEQLAMNENQLNVLVNDELAVLGFLNAHSSEVRVNGELFEFSSKKTLNQWQQLQADIAKHNKAAEAHEPPPLQLEPVSL
jgi:hypothetical protein